LSNHKKPTTGNYLPLNASHKPAVLAAHGMGSTVVGLKIQHKKSDVLTIFKTGKKD